MHYTTTSLIKRTRVFLTVVVCVLVVLSGRLIYIQLIQGPTLQLRAGEQWHRDLPLGARRGQILDRNGQVMVQSVPTYSVYVRPVAVTNASQVAQVLSSQLGLSFEKVLNKATSRTASEHLIKMQVERSTAIAIIAHNLDGVFLAQTYRRHYPLGVIGGQVLGLVSVDNHGQEGLEAFYNQLLRGRDGRIATPSDLRGIPRPPGVEFFFPSTPGQDISLNIDAGIQNVLQTALARAHYEQMAQSVGGIVFDIQTGGILASGAAPFFDMNNQPRDDILALLAGMRNLPIVNVLEPGSTFKIITLAIAIEEGLIDGIDEKFNCPGFRMIGGERVKCWRRKGHGTQTLAEGVRNSCNAVFMDLALRIGVERYYQYLRRFGIGTKTGVDFYGESAGLVLPERYVRPVDLARIGFGQAIAVSPIQFITVFSALVGDGVLRTPRFASHNPGSVRNQRIVSPQTSATLRELLHGVVEQGSGKHSRNPGFVIGGKTGTAQKYVDGVIAQGRYISSFIAFMSVAGVPRYAVFLYVDEPSRQGYYGSIVAAPYVGEVFAGIIRQLNLQPDIVDVGAPIFVTVPDVANMQTHQAVARLQSLGFHIDVCGEGLRAIGTFPSAGTVLERGSPVVIRT